MARRSPPFCARWTRPCLFRTLTFRRGEGRVVVSAGNRRLITVDAAEGPGASGAPGHSGPLADAARRRPARPSSGTRSFRPCPAAPRFGSEQLRPRKGAETFAAGTTAAALASAWGVDLASAAESGPAGPVDDFLGVAPVRFRAPGFASRRDASPKPAATPTLAGPAARFRRFRGHGRTRQAPTRRTARPSSPSAALPTTAIASSTSPTRPMPRS